MKTSHSTLLARAGVAALIAGLAACSPADDEMTAAAEPAAQSGDAATAQTPAPIAGEGAGEGGGEGEGGDGGEFGIDPAVASSDPVIYLTALEVMRAHYLAGMAAYDEGREAIGGTMFSHPISEIYVDLEEVLDTLGAPGFYDELDAAARAPFEDASAEEVQARVDAVLTAIDTASGFAPSGDASDAAVQARVVANMAERAALQYAFAADTDMHSGPYLDGYGFYRSAAEILSRHEAAIAAADAEAAASLRHVVELLASAYPTAIAPEQLDADAPLMVAEAESASEAVATLD